MLKINFSKQAQKFLRTVHPKHGKQIANKIIELRVNPKPTDLKKLTGFTFKRTDIGEYIIIFDVNEIEKILKIILIGKRNDNEVYNHLKNLPKR